MYYCLISKCANLGRKPTFKPNYVSVFCHILTDLDALETHLNSLWFYEVTDPDLRIKEFNADIHSGGLAFHTSDDLTTKDKYIDYVIKVVTNSQPDVCYGFQRLSLNYDCCELYMYVTDDSTKIVEDKYVLLTEEENKVLWSM